MNLRNTLFAAVVGGALGLPLAASALTIDGITFEPGAIFETADLFEGEVNGGPITAAGDELIGIGIVNRILAADNTVLWENGDNGRELTIYFFGYMAEDFTTTNPGAGAGIDQITFSGGRVQIYSDTNEDFSAAGTLAQGIASATNGNLFLDLEGSPTGGVGGFSGDPITLSATAIRIQGLPFLSALNVVGTGLLDVVGGAAAAHFDTNTFGCDATAAAPCPDIADKSFTSSGQIPVSPGGAWAFRGTGEVQDYAVPEPATLAMLGLGLLGAGAVRRRTKA